MAFPLAAWVAVASQTWVMRPPWTSLASHSTASPTLAVPRKLLFSSMVVKPAAPGGSEARQP